MTDRGSTPSCSCDNAVKPDGQEHDAPAGTPGAQSSFAGDIATVWQTLFDCRAPRRPPAFLQRAIEWREQVQTMGDISLPVRRDLQVAVSQIAASRLQNVAADPENSVAGTMIDTAGAAGPVRRPGRARTATPSRSGPAPATSQLTPGTRLIKHHGGHNHVVEVTTSGFVYEDQAFGSLSAIAKHITGTHWNGLLFFGLRKRGVYPKRQRHG